MILQTPQDNQWQGGSRKISRTDSLSSPDNGYYGETYSSAVKKPEADIKSFLKSIGIKGRVHKQNVHPPHIPLTKTAKTKDADAEKEMLYDRLMSDLNDLMIVEKKEKKEQNTGKL